MKSISVIPITNAPLPETLSYFAREDLPIGALIQIPVGNKTMFGIVQSSDLLSKTKITIKKTDFAMKKLENPLILHDFGPAFLETLTQLSVQYLIPLHHTAHVLFPSSVLGHLTETKSLPIFKKIIICPTWRQVEFVANEIKETGVRLHGRQTPKQQATVLLGSENDTLITTPAFAHFFITTDNTAVIYYSDSEHYYRFRKPFFDYVAFLNLLVKNKNQKIKIAPEPKPDPSKISYHVNNQDIKYTYTLVIHTDILLHIKRLIESGQKVLLQVPRRGFAAGVVCKDCKQVAIDDASGLRMKVVERDGQFFYESKTKTTDARHTCQYCRSTRIDMFGFGTEAITKVLKRNFSQYPISVLDQDTGKKALLAARKQEGGIVLTTNTGIWHLDSNTYHAVFLGLEFMLAIPGLFQIPKALQTLAELSARAQAVWIPLDREPHGIVADFVNQKYDKIEKENKNLAKSIHLPPHGTLAQLSFVAGREAAAPLIIELESIAKNQTDTELFTETRPHGTYSTEVILSVTAKNSENLFVFLQKTKKTIPISIVKVNSRS